jgi:putative spermidine/putrescine transport system ATP-binding protein
MMATSEAAVQFIGASRHYGDVRAVDAVNLEIRDGEFFAMLGPSGSGKTTCLRLIAGFEQPDAGRVLIHGRDMQGVPPYERDVNTVFQDYALFPHLSVLDNVAYGLMVRKVPRTERRRRAEEALEMVQLAGFGGRRPAQLSGGQRQRVALARALVNHPRVLLLDEPLGALDLKLREQMRQELKALQRRVGITFIFVTHDQEEALGMSDRLAVFNHGRIEQLGTPAEVYGDPQTEFVARFVGVSNILAPAVTQRYAGVAAAAALRPERIAVRQLGAGALAGECHAVGTITRLEFLGATTRYDVALDDGTTLTVMAQNNSANGTAALRAGDRTQVCWRREDLRTLNPATGTR